MCHTRCLGALYCEFIAVSRQVLKRTLHDFIDNTDNNRVRAVMLAKHKLGLKDGSSKKMAAFFKCVFHVFRILPVCMVDV